MSKKKLLPEYPRSSSELQAKLDAVGFMNKYLVPDIDGLLDLALAGHDGAKEVANSLGMRISALVENLLLDEGSKSADIIYDWISQKQQQSSVAKAELVADVAALGNCFDSFRKWINIGDRSTNESELYVPISQFFCFVASCIGSLHKSQPTCPERLIVPFSKADRIKNSHVGVILGLAPVDGYKAGTLITKLEAGENKSSILANAFAIAEVWSGKRGVCKSLPELFQHTRDIYAGQYNRRFAWGMAIGGKQIQVVFFGPNYALASPTINIDRPNGRAQLVKLLVNWSFCEYHRLGYDPTITYNDELKCYEILADREGVSTIYYSSGAVIEPDRLFGRRTRCFTASTAKPAHGVKIEPDIFIKDAWVEATEHTDDDRRDECRYLKSIAKMLEEVHGLDGKCPKFHGGSRVAIKRLLTGCGMVTIEDTGRSILDSDICEKLANAKAVPLRVHKRICVQGIGKPLKLVNNVFELICVVADAMECHWNIYDHCGIYHRDISVNNIMFSGSGSNVKGMLIDFDHSIFKEDKEAVHNFKQSGTFPFMSINNLEGSLTEYSVLDDWESFIYNLCWIGVYGWWKAVDVAKKPNSPKEAQQAQQEYKRISRWERDNIYECADNKRTDLHSEELFYQITSQFDNAIPAIGSLKRLVCKLRKTLIDDHTDEKLQGSVRKPLRSQTMDGSVYVLDGQGLDPELYDPFDERVKEADKIAKRLLENIKEAARQARAHLKSLE
ncbi:hypothetical protein GGI22_002245 [Coemansia erecta]|nr:hypothetical protein GGI22_002245 [Coemansia erecta]